MSLDYYMNEARKYNILSPQEEIDLIGEAKAGSLKARKLLLNSNLRFVVQTAHLFKYYCRRGHFTLEDLVQEGNLGLLTAYEKFSLEKKVKFITYAVWWIRASIITHIIRNYDLIRFGTSSVERKAFFKMGMFYELTTAASTERRAELTKEIAFKLNLKEEQVLTLESRFLAKAVSMNVTTNQQDDQDYIERVAIADDNIENNISRAKVTNLLMDAIKTVELTPREALLIEERWLKPENLDTLQDLATNFGVSKERVRQIQNRVFERLKVELRDLTLNDIDF